MKNLLDDDYKIESIFPLPLYMTKRNSDLEHSERQDIKDVIGEGMYDPNEGDSSGGNWTTHNSNIFNTKLEKLKQFCDKHITNYVEETLNPKEDVNYYITQSWLSITNPGEWHPHHRHANSIISGVFYIDTEDTDRITWVDPNIDQKEKGPQTEPKEINKWNGQEWSFAVEKNLLLLFPSWMTHYVPINKSDRNEPRMTIAFNTYANGRFGNKANRNELFL
tara:strand:+ start:380 stop:1042 length:663 start_codon:yes stop_codon:yes gene_type:complete